MARTRRYVVLGIDFGETSTWVGIVWMAAGLAVFRGIGAEWAEWVAIGQALWDGVPLDERQVQVIGAAASTVAGLLRTFLSDRLPSRAGPAPREG